MSTTSTGRSRTLCRLSCSPSTSSTCTRCWALVTLHTAFHRLSRSAAQRVLLVPGSYGSQTNPGCDLACYDAMCTVDAWYPACTRSARLHACRNFLAWAETDLRVVGLAPWNWLGCPGCAAIHDELGTDALNTACACKCTAHTHSMQTVAAWRSIGAIVKG